MVSPSVAIGRVSNSPKTVRDSIIRLRAINAVLDEAISASGRLYEDPRAFSLRADLDVPKTLLEFERELDSLTLQANLTREEVALEAKQTEDWKRRHAISVGEGATHLALQALSRQHEHELRTSELRLELEEWEQLVADYSAGIDMLRNRIRG